MTTTKILRTVAVAVLSLMTAACVKYHPAHSEWHNIPADGWEYNDTLVFNADHADSASIGGLVLNVRHSASYAYSNLWLEISYMSNDSVVADTFNVRVTDDFGRRYGTGSGVSFQLVDTVALRHRPDTATALGIRHIMRIDILEGIEQVGIAY